MDDQADDDAATFPVPLEMSHLLSDPLSAREWADWFDCGEKTMLGMLREYEARGRAERFGRTKWRVRLVACPIDYIRRFARAPA
jgi:hypothetical protein